MTKEQEAFLKSLDRTIDLMYQARMENNGAVLTLPIKDLYEELRKGF